MILVATLSGYDSMNNEDDECTNVLEQLSVFTLIKQFLEQIILQIIVMSTSKCHIIVFNFKFYMIPNSRNDQFQSDVQVSVRSPLISFFFDEMDYPDSKVSLTADIGKGMTSSRCRLEDPFQSAASTSPVSPSSRRLATLGASKGR